MPIPNDDLGEGVIGRKMMFCPSLQAMETDELIKTCPDCEQYFLYCCACSRKHYDTGRPCHHFRLVFTDGACRLNGQSGATAGIGIASGQDEIWQRDIPITAQEDKGQKRTSQRAELLAAISGLEHMVEMYERFSEEETPARRVKKSGLKRMRGEFENGTGKEGQSWVIATDSVYVVKGMTEWLPVWKENHLRTNRNTRPANLDLFVRLDAAINAVQAEHNVKIGFWHIGREHNTVADRLAKMAAEDGDPE
ncbi:MAG: hypothetical protein Q9219_005109 [cf. Caloplaca sp. 3 TL-2023]